MNWSRSCSRRAASGPARRRRRGADADMSDVVAIGGGATGCGLAALTPRGLGVTLVEMGDVAMGTSDRYQGLPHTGARYVASDVHHGPHRSVARAGEAQ